jgi:hypothetical protein
VLVVASRCAVIVSTPEAFIDVVVIVSGPTVVDDTLTDRGSLVPLRCVVPSWYGLGMNQGFFLVSRGLRRLLQGQPIAPRGQAFGLLHSRSLEETSNLITGPPSLGSRRLRHVAEKHCGSDDVLAGSVED